jgi:hypothetical protein
MAYRSALQGWGRFAAVLRKSFGNNLLRRKLTPLSFLLHMGFSVQPTFLAPGLEEFI